MSTIKVDVVSAEGQVFAGEAELLVAPALEGDVGIAPRHAPLLTPLRAGEVAVHNGENVQHIFVGGGVLEVQPNHVTVLADTALRAKDIDEAAALEAKQRAEEAIANQRSDHEVSTAHIELAAALAQLQVVQHARRKSRR